MKVFIYACEGIYGGYHGIEDFTVEEFEDDENLDDIWRDWVPEMSYDLMDSYDTIQLDPDDYENDEEFWEAMEEERNANVDGYVIPIKADVTLSVDELKKIAFQLGADSFKEEYCERC